VVVTVPSFVYVPLADSDLHTSYPAAPLEAFQET